MALSDAAIRAAKPTSKQFKLYDEGGLFLIVKPSGGKLWRLKYRHLGKEQALSLGAIRRGLEGGAGQAGSGPQADRQRQKPRL